MTSTPCIAEPTALEDWEDSLTHQDAELWNEINDRCADFCDSTPEEARAFMDELSDYGITTAEQFQDAEFYATSSIDAEAEFVEYLVTELACQELPPYLVIDWQASWDRNYRHDFFSIKHKTWTVFFHNNF
tara:strand:- start:191 stop:583 length:393 start_codon:yes stop_codon:yes gene_type:complete